MDKPLVNQNEIEAAYVDYDRNHAINNFKVACLLGFILMPAGTLLDRYYLQHRAPELISFFLNLRLISSFLIAVFYGILLTPLGRKYYRFQGVTLFMLPASFIALMIYHYEG